MSHTHMVIGPKPHAHSVWLYWGVFFALVLLTILTVFLAKFDFGSLSVFVTLLIAGTKALLVMGIFMHLAFDNKFLGVITAVSFIFLALLIVFCVLDLGTRQNTDMMQKNFLPRDEKILKHQKDNPTALPLRPKLKEAEKGKLIFVAPGEH